MADQPALVDWECDGPRDCVGTAAGCRHCAPGAYACPAGDRHHFTDDYDGGPCTGCQADAAKLADEFWQDQAEAFPEALR